MLPLNRTPCDPSAETGAAFAHQPAVRPTRTMPGVLVVDDDHLLRSLVQLGLERDDFDVWSAATGWEALRLYGEHRERIDIALLDVRMPGIDGPQTLDGLREINPQILACFMTGDLGAYRLDELRRRGAAHVIAKPFQLDELSMTLRLLLDGVPTCQLPSGGGDVRDRFRSNDA